MSHSYRGSLVRDDGDDGIGGRGFALRIRGATAALPGSGARIRRADTLKVVMRHLRAYRPTVLIVDMGLPDGNEADLIAGLANAPHRTPAFLAISGDPDCESRALAAGAGGFLAKPIVGLGIFQQKLLSEPQEDACIAYIAGFMSGVARSTQDSALQNAAAALARPRRSDCTLQQVSGLVRNRLTAEAGRIGL